MPKFPPAKLGLLDYLQRTVTLALFGITCAGAYTLGEGATNILSKRYRLKQSEAPPVATPEAKP